MIIQNDDKRESGILRQNDNVRNSKYICSREFSLNGMYAIKSTVLQDIDDILSTNRKWKRDP